MKKPIIGILSCSTCFTDDNIFNDRYYILNNYVKELKKYNVIPIGVLYNDEQIIEDALDLCDGFLLPGGSKIIKAHIEIIDYAVKNKKPFLGICMGMQALGVYSNLKYDNPESNVELISDNKIHYQNDKENNKLKTLNDLKNRAHYVNINRDSLLFRIIKKEKIKVNSLHKYHIPVIGNKFIIAATSEDGIIEALEYKESNSFIIGVQWHPELMHEMDILFKEFIKKCK